MFGFRFGIWVGDFMFQDNGLGGVAVGCYGSEGTSHLVCRTMFSASSESSMLLATID
jgi:hypothetical protein